MQGEGCLVFFVAAYMGLLMPLCARAKTVVSTPSVYMQCLQSLPTTLSLPPNAPETMRLLVPKKNYLIDYESLIAGNGWGASLKYRNAHCEVVVYAYNHNQSILKQEDAQKERADFDGFPAESTFEKEVGDFVFYGTAGLSAFEPKADKQVQMFSVAAVHDTFIKYRTVCRHITDIPLDANYRLADVITTQVIKETLMPLDTCLTKAKARSKKAEDEKKNVS